MNASCIIKRELNFCILMVVSLFASHQCKCKLWLLLHGVKKIKRKGGERKGSKAWRGSPGGFQAIGPAVLVGGRWKVVAAAHNKV